ncbi:MAG TPA: hypothetical protein VFE19_03380 [Jatrophihabitantaceae bacterium]|nr:hypothetical protein [Jatrophihabitantaceae bacterium]
MIRGRLVLRVLGVLIAGAPAIVGPAHATVLAVAPDPAVHTTASTHRRELPKGGRRILGHYRVVTYYGGADGPQLGILGSKPPDQIAGDIERRARQWRRYGLPVQPAMELIATVAQGSAGSDGSYSQPISDGDVQRYLTAAHHHRMLLILDFQPGHAQFLDQVQHFARFLRDPWVSVALDPEWKMHGHQVPGKVIGHTAASAVNSVRHYLAGIVKRDKLPDKLLVVHQFTTDMIRNRDRIKPGPGVEVTFHADGFGDPSAKRATWGRLAFPRHPYGAGFKLFTRQDKPMMTPHAVMALRPRVDLISYQ